MLSKLFFLGTNNDLDPVEESEYLTPASVQLGQSLLIKNGFETIIHSCIVQWSAEEYLILGGMGHISDKLSKNVFFYNFVTKVLSEEKSQLQMNFPRAKHACGYLTSLSLLNPKKILILIGGHAESEGLEVGTSNFSVGKP